jgi:putative restriction endonuclease
MASPSFGHIPGVAPGHIFPDRRALKAAGLHRDLIAGISWSKAYGAEAIVVSGGYEDDADRGGEIIYTGHGGNSETGRQIAGQRLERGNLALARSCLDGLPVRVIRGSRGDPEHAPPFGYRYDGLYRVVGFWSEIGKSGFSVWRFHLVKESQTPRRIHEEPVAYGESPRAETTIQRIVRNNELVQMLKGIHNYQCQVCGIRLLTLAGPYAEGAHIRPLGHPHNGPDATDNILCLCPNDHVRFDYGAIVIAEDLTILDSTSLVPLGQLRTHPEHQIDSAHLRYHRELFARQLPVRDT